MLIKIKKCYLLACYLIAPGGHGIDFVVGIVGSHLDSCAFDEGVQTVDDVVATEAANHRGRCDGSEKVQLVCQTDCHIGGKHLVRYNSSGTNQCAWEQLACLN